MPNAAFVVLRAEVTLTPRIFAWKLAERDLVISPDTLRRWLSAEGLWQRRR